MVVLELVIVLVIFISDDEEWFVVGEEEFSFFIREAISVRQG